MQSTSIFALAVTLLATSACAVTTGTEEASQREEAALTSTNHPGPNYIIEKQTFDRGTPKVLDGAGTKGGKAELETWDTTHFPPGQRWTISAAGELRSAADESLCLDVTGARFAPGVAIETWSCNGGSNQKWLIEADEANGPQFGVIRPLGHPDLCIDAARGATADHTPLQLWPCNGGSNQHWALFSAG